MLSSRQKVNDILNRRGTEGAFWTGHPNGDTIPIYAKEWNIEPDREAIYNFLNDDCRWITADAGYCHPEGLYALNPAHGITRGTLSSGGCLAGAQTVADIEAYPWPDVKYCDFTEIYRQIEQFPDKIVFTGLWSPFFHLAADFFGMENYFIKMHENAAVIEAATERVVDYYTAANDMFLSGLRGRADVMFFGNDFGTQLDLFISPEHFRRFVMPSFKRIIEVGKRHGMLIMLHSCGSIYRIIPDLIDAGVDVLHPIQAQAAGMGAGDLAQYKNDLAFLGGIDAQSFFVNAAPAQIRDEVLRVREILGPNIVISPSHEEILPNIPAENILAMANAAKE